MQITVTGLAEVQRALKALPKHIVATSFARGLSAAGGVIERELAARTPEGDETTNNEEFGHLVDNITSEVLVDTGARGGKVRVGFGKKDKVAKWVEFGHRQVTHEPGKRQIGTVAAKPFMRPAAVAAAGPAIEAFQKVLEGDLAGGGKNLLGGE